MQVTGALRNFAGDKATCSDMLLGQVVERALRTLELFFTHSELVYNTCRVLSKLSIEEKCCRIMLDRENLYAGVGLLQRVLLAYSEHAAIVSRLSFTLANLAMLYDEARAAISPEGFDSLVSSLLVPYVSLSSASRSHFDALLKSVRLIANVVLDNETGLEMTQGNAAVMALDQVLHMYTEYEEMTLISVSCLANLLFYDQPQRPVIADPALRQTLVLHLIPPLLQTINTETTREALRALSNLTRHTEAAHQVGQSHLVEPLLLLLDHNSAEVVYYSLGCLVNMSRLAKEFVYSEQCFERLVGLLTETGTEAVDLSLQTAMVLSNLSVSTKGLVPWDTVAGEDTVNRLGAVLATLTKDTVPEPLLGILRALNAQLPTALLPCPAPGCGRKFPTKAKLEEHWARRHEE